MNYVSCLLILITLACTVQEKNTSVGTIQRLEPELDQVLSPDAKIEIIAEGYDWSEGPLWLDAQQTLLFSDVPKNIIYQWTEEKGASVYLSPSGFTGTTTRSKEPGSNGLLLDDEGNLILCQHGDRRLAVMDAELSDPKPEFLTIADKFDGKRFSSPNDAAFRNYDFYFTDPPYGLEKQDEDQDKEIPFQGVYKVTADGKIILLIDSLTRPNGIAFSPNGKLFVANSDSAKARWYQYELNDSAVVWGKIFYDATSLTATEKGLPDGLKIDSQGNTFATGPGGVFIFSPTGKLIGKIQLQEASSNCALSGDEKTLFVTNDMYVLRIKLR